MWSFDFTPGILLNGVYICLYDAFNPSKLFVNKLLARNIEFPCEI